MQYALLITTLLALITTNATLAQICDENQAPSTPSDRFAKNDGLVIDSKTGLMWKQCTEGTRYNVKNEQCDDEANVYTWQGLLQYIQQLNQGKIGNSRNYSDWRIPNIKELESIVEHRCMSPAINLDVFSNTSRVSFWSSSTSFSSPYKAWAAHFDDGKITLNDKDEFNTRAYARLVRDWK
ncbi:MAG: DUF1566 domain-containing protein [Gammaproteobacteria bacterium]|nr:DUF1566 domain-containing protein [Gammaproteobacteria bacterium]